MRGLIFLYVKTRALLHGHVVRQRNNLINRNYSEVRRRPKRPIRLGAWPLWKSTVMCVAPFCKRIVSGMAEVFNALQIALKDFSNGEYLSNRPAYGS